jgi:four helix bundle protein
MSVLPADSRSRQAVKDFTDLEVWKAAREMRREAYKLAKTLPDFEKFALATQLRRAAVSVTANLAEGFERFGYQENAQFCRHARGSVYELRDHLITCMDESYVSRDEGLKLDTKLQRVAMLLKDICEQPSHVRSQILTKSGVPSFEFRVSNSEFRR